MCYVTNLDHETAKSRGIIGLTVGGSYSNNVTVNRYNGYIRGTNMIVRCLGVILWTLILMFVKLDSLR